MNQRFAASISLLLSLLYLPNLFAAEIAQTGTPARKLQRGFLNVALSPLEISNELASEKNVDTAIPTWVGGLGRGSVFAVGRALAGVYDMVTAPVPYPADYAPLVYPEFAWEHLDKKE